MLYIIIYFLSFYHYYKRKMFRYRGMCTLFIILLLIKDLFILLFSFF